MAIISNGTTVASGGTVQGSASNLSGIPAPSNSAILTGVASVSAGNVGSYSTFTGGSFGKNLNDTFATNNAMFFVGLNYQPSSGTVQPSGTYRAMGVTQSNNGVNKASGLFLRIS